MRGAAAQRDARRDVNENFVRRRQRRQYLHAEEPSRPGGSHRRRRYRWCARRRHGVERAARHNPDGFEPAGARRLAGDASNQGHPRHQAYPGDRSDRARHGQRPGESIIRGLRRLRYETRRVAAPPGKDQRPCGEGRPVSADSPALLVVDDNDDNRYTLTRRLTREGYTNLTTATNGREALDLLRSKRFDLILLDIMMPDMNGYEMLERMKADAELRNIPVIMISALSEIDSVIR